MMFKLYVKLFAMQVTKQLNMTYRSLFISGMCAGVAIKPLTQIDNVILEAIEKGLVDLILIMSVEPGFGG